MPLWLYRVRLNAVTIKKRSPVRTPSPVYVAVGPVVIYWVGVRIEGPVSTKCWVLICKHLLNTSSILNGFYMPLTWPSEGIAFHVICSGPMFSTSNSNFESGSLKFCIWNFFIHLISLIDLWQWHIDLIDFHSCLLVVFWKLKVAVSFSTVLPFFVIVIYIYVYAP